MQDDNNLCVFRLCSLWFDNCNDKVVNELLKVLNATDQAYRHADSWKFIVWT